MTAPWSGGFAAPASSGTPQSGIGTNYGGAMGAPKKRQLRRMQSSEGGPVPQAQQDQINKAGAAQAPTPTFAQMQAAGQARPAPSQVMQQQASATETWAPYHPQANGQPKPPSPVTTATNPTPVPGLGSAGVNPTTQTTPTTTAPTADQMKSLYGTAVANALPSAANQAQFQSALTNSLANPSRYDLSQVQQVKDALTSQLEQQFGSQKKKLDEEMARRGVYNSSIAGGYLGDLGTNQANALATMNADLIKDAANTYAQDRSSALNTAANYNLGSLSAVGNYQNANNDLMLRVAALLGLPSGSTGSTGSTSTPTNTGPQPAAPVSGGTQNSTPPAGTTGGPTDDGTGYTSPANSVLRAPVLNAPIPIEGGEVIRAAQSPAIGAGSAGSAPAPFAGGPSLYNTNPNQNPQAAPSAGASAGGQVYDAQGNPMNPASLPPDRLTPEAKARLAAGWAVQLLDNGGAVYHWTPRVDASTLAINNGTSTVTPGSAGFQSALNTLLGKG